MNHHISIGASGENIAERFLIEHGYIILHRGWRKRSGEIDIIAREVCSKEIVFVEVKTRTTSQFGNPEEKVTPKKLKSIYITAQYFLLENREITEQKHRIDVISVYIDRKNNQLNIQHLKNISPFS